MDVYAAEENRMNLLKREKVKFTGRLSDVIHHCAVIESHSSMGFHIFAFFFLSSRIEAFGAG